VIYYSDRYIYIYRHIPPFKRYKVIGAYIYTYMKKVKKTHSDPIRGCKILLRGKEISSRDHDGRPKWSAKKALPPNMRLLYLYISRTLFNKEIDKERERYYEDSISVLNNPWPRNINLVPFRYETRLYVLV